MWAFETSKPHPQLHISSTPPNPSQMVYQQRTEHKYTSLWESFSFKPSQTERTLLYSERVTFVTYQNRTGESGIVVEILGNPVSHLLIWPSLRFSCHRLSCGNISSESSLWLMLRNVMNYSDHSSEGRERRWLNTVVSQASRLVFLSLDAKPVIQSVLDIQQLRKTIRSKQWWLTGRSNREKTWVTYGSNTSHTPTLT